MLHSRSRNVHQSTLNRDRPHFIGDENIQVEVWIDDELMTVRGPCPRQSWPSSKQGTDVAGPDVKCNHADQTKREMQSGF